MAVAIQDHERYDAGRGQASACGHQPVIQFSVSRTCCTKLSLYDNGEVGHCPNGAAARVGSLRESRPLPRVRVLSANVDACRAWFDDVEQQNRKDDPRKRRVVPVSCRSCCICRVFRRTIGKARPVAVGARPSRPEISTGRYWSPNRPRPLSASSRCSPHGLLYCRGQQFRLWYRRVVVPTTGSTQIFQNTMIR